ncbi:hemagglutinin/amebocyte aggregation factor-like [Mustelus asterias]
MRTLGLLFVLIVGIHGETPAQKLNEVQSPDKRWVNGFDNRIDFSCPAHETIYRIVSQHNNHHEDRQWDFECKTTFGERPTCEWTDYVNYFDGEFSFTCPFNSFISGMMSYHDNHHEDRRWRFYCCHVKSFCRGYCQWTSYINGFDAYFKWKVPDSSYLVGVSSYHDNHHEDRRWKYQHCTKQQC